MITLFVLFCFLLIECLKYTLPPQDAVSLLAINLHHLCLDESYSFSIFLTWEGEAQCNHDKKDSESIRVINVEMKSNTWKFAFP